MAGDHRSLRGVSWRNAAAFLLCLIGLSQGFAYLTGWQALQRVSLSTAASPLPVVFCDLHGYEAYASEISLDLEDERHHAFRFFAAPGSSLKIAGPGFRRHMYMGVAAAAPRLAKPIVESVLCYGFRGPLMSELALPSPIIRIHLLIDSRTFGKADQWAFDLSCSE